MSQPAAPAPAAGPRRRRGLGATIWFVGMAGLWIAFGVLALVSPGTLADLWEWARGLPLVLEIVVWFLAFPWMLGLAVWESSWPDWLRVLLVLCFALGWTLVSIPRRAS